MKSLSLSKPHLIIVVGIAGAGKSFFADQFSETFQAPLLSSQKLLQTIAPLRLTPKAQQLIINSLASTQLSELFKTKQSIIIDLNSDTRTERVELARLARQHDYEPLLIWVQTEPSTAKQRAIKPKRNKTQASSMTPEEHDAAVRRFTTPNGTEKSIVISGKHTYASQAKIVLTKLAKPRVETATQASPPSRRPLSGRITVR